MTDVFLLDPLAVGLVRWHAPGRATTLVVKATFSLAADGEPVVVPDPDPLFEGDAQGVGLSSASDFVPAKLQVDLLLAGHAHASTLSTVHASLVSCGDWARSWVARSDAPTTRFPLAGGHVRETARRDSAIVHVGPSSPGDPIRASLAGRTALGAHGLPVGPLDPAFDVRFFNVAAPEQQLAAFPSWIRLDGVLAGAPVRRVWLGSRWPFGVAVRGRGLAEELAFSCDTIAVDTDWSTLSLVWRAPLRDAASVEWIAVALASPDQPPTTGDLIASSLDATPIASRDVPTVTLGAPVEARSPTIPMMVVGEAGGRATEPSASLDELAPDTPRAPRATIPDTDPPGAPSFTDVHDEEPGRSAVHVEGRSLLGSLPFQPRPGLAAPGETKHKTAPPPALTQGTPFQREGMSLPFRASGAPSQRVQPPSSAALAPALVPPAPLSPGAPPLSPPSRSAILDAAPLPPPSFRALPLAPSPSPTFASPDAHPAPPMVSTPSPDPPPLRVDVMRGSDVEPGTLSAPAMTSALDRYAAARVAIETGTAVRDAVGPRGFDEPGWEKHHRRMLLRARRDPGFERDLVHALNEARRAHAQGAARARR